MHVLFMRLLDVLFIEKKVIEMFFWNTCTLQKDTMVFLYDFFICVLLTLYFYGLYNKQFFLENLSCHFRTDKIIVLENFVNIM